MKKNNGIVTDLRVVSLRRDPFLEARIEIMVGRNLLLAFEKRWSWRKMKPQRNMGFQFSY